MRMNFRQKVRSIFTIGKPKLDFSNDTFIIAYPKSGITWLRWLIANYILNGQSDFIKTNELIPDIHVDSHLVNLIKPPRIIKAHYTYRNDIRKIIYVVRNVNDVVVSYYYFQIKYNFISEDMPFEDFFHLFISGKIWPGSWESHVVGWLDNQPSDFLVVRYEDLKRNTRQELLRVLTFLDFEIDNSRIELAIEASSFENMSRLEKLQKSAIPRNANSRDDIQFVRSGIIGDHLNYLTTRMNTQLLFRNRRGLRRLNYL